MALIKISIALFLLRIAATRRYVHIIKTSMAVVVIWTAAIFLYNIFQCWPVQAQWNLRLTDATCVSGTSYVSAAYSFSVLAVGSDWFYALLPIPMIWGVKMNSVTKGLVMIILSMGVLYVFNLDLQLHLKLK